MSEQDDNYEDLTQCGLESELEQELLDVQRECTFMWTNKKGEAFGVIMSYLPSDGKIWLTCAERRARVPALRRFPSASTVPVLQWEQERPSPTKGHASFMTVEK